MELKKNPKKDLKSWRSIFLEGGLVVALGVCILVFSLNQKDRVIEIPDMGGVGDEIDMVEITVEQEQQKVEPVRQTIAVIADILNVVKNDTQITTNFDFVDFDTDINLVQLDIESEEIEEETIFLAAEEMPSFLGGDLNSFGVWVKARFRYPVIAQENNIQGRVVLSFVVERDGNLTNIQVLQTPDPLLSDEAVRVVSSSPKWSPGKQRDMPVRIRYTLPIEFRLQN